MVTDGHGKGQMDTVLDTLEQQARDLLERMEVPNAQSMTAGELVELANLMGARNAALEEAAKVCDDVVEDMSHCGTDGARGALYASRGIRALKRE